MNDLVKPRIRMHADGTVTFMDGFANLLSGLGLGNPKTAANTYLLNCSQQDLESAYRTSTWFGKIVDIPADDATRAWRSWQADKEQIELLEAEEKRLQVRQKVRQALIWSRLYGGAVIIPGGLPGAPDKPLPIDRVGKGTIKFLTVLHRFDDITPLSVVRDPLSEFYGQPEYWTINGQSGQQTTLHPSRVILVNGRKTPSRLGGEEIWGDSVWMHLEDAVRNADAGAAVVGALMQEAKIDVVRVPDMMMGMATAEYEAVMMKRFRMAAMLKSVSNVLLLDKDDEWDQKQITWAGIPDVVTLLLTILSGAADIPVTRLIGTSAKGLNATGEGDLRNYYDNVNAKQDLVLSPALTPLDEMLIRSALGSRPAEVWYSWKSLFQPTDKEQAEVDKLEAETTNIYATSGLLPTDALAKTVQNRMIESGRWPGLEQALEESKMELEAPDPAEDPDAEPGDRIEEI
jgi:phage-related protein (TIGR01555 family)